MGADFWIVFEWWGTLFLVGAAAFPLTRTLFGISKSVYGSHDRRLRIHSLWWDEGYLFSKAVGMAVATWVVYVLSIVKILPFTKPTIVIALAALFIGGLLLGVGEKQKKTTKIRFASFLPRLSSQGVLFLVEELFFFGALLFWSWIKAHEPSIHGLEKFMDFGFTKSILNSLYFPPPDMWYAGFPVNYYYFGHLVMAVVTKLSGLDLAYTFNLMLASIFAFTLTMSFSIGKQLLRGIGKMGEIGGGLLTAFLVTLAGNMQTLYAFTKGYTGDNVKPFWELFWPVTDFVQKLPEGLNRYWYANATRFIPFTIHEFPSYSFVVSDVHGHVLSLPFVLLAVGLLISMFGNSYALRVTRYAKDARFSAYRISHIAYLFYGFLVGVLLMTNALDGPIYLGLFLVLFVIHNSRFLIQENDWWKEKGIVVGAVLVTALVTSIPFLFHFQSFVHGLAINCPPSFLANTKIGPFLFEGVEKCQHSPLWMMLILWGFFIYCGAWMFIKHFKANKILVIFYFFSIALIIFPEFFYFKDIYPMHFRSNTMFKLGYQAFILFSIVSGYTITQWLATRDKRPVTSKRIFLIFLLPQLFLVSIYPIFSVRSYFGELKSYKGLDGTAWLKEQYPDDWRAIEWLNQNVTSDKQPALPAGRQVTAKKNAIFDVSRITYHVSPPVLVEADGDSYTDYNRFSAFTGMPTVVGWAVHEWLWRGSYDVVSPRREEVRLIYESTDVSQIKQILEKYHVRYVMVGTLERQKFKNLSEAKLARLGKEVFRSEATVIYAVN